MTVSAADFTVVADLVRRRSAIVLEPGKEYLVESRLLPVARAQGLASVGDLVARVRTAAPPALLTAVVEALTTNETSWFRDRTPFEVMERTVLPELFARTTDKRLAIWSGACSTGQEPYSLAMMLQDQLTGRPGWSASILATDLSGEVVEKARSGRYTQLEANRGLPAAMLVRHFERSGTSWQLTEAIRRMVTFRELNLAAALPAIGPFDVVFLRNVLIYFDEATKREVLGRVRRVLKPGGYLFLGTAETPINLDAAYERVALGGATVYRTPGRRAA